MDVTTPEQAAAVLRRRPPSVRGTLLAALDHWLILARHEKAPEADWLEHLLSVADSDPWRRGVRAAREHNDRQEMEKLAREVDTTSQPPEALFVLEKGLAQRGASDAALALLRRGQQAFPGDFWINFDLGIALRHCHPPQNEEAIRFLTVALALRPKSEGVRVNLAYTLARAGRLDEAIIAYRLAIGVKPDYGQVYLYLGLALADNGQLDEGIAACRRAGELKPDDGNAYFNLGTLLNRAGRVDEAAAAYRRAIELVPDDAESHCSLAFVLRDQGKFTEALIALERGHELGSGRKNWPYPSAEWVKQCRRQIELDARLPAFLRGEVQPADAAERDEYAQICYARKRYVAAARLFAQGRNVDPKSAAELEGSDRYRAACAAALAGCGRGDDAGQLDNKELAGWRNQALEWLRADLNAYRKLLPLRNPKERHRLQERLWVWQSDPALAGLRDATLDARVSAAEQESCKQLWREVQALLARAGTAEFRGPASPAP
jgi:tetratricopeptide (TPR) repeat protein